MGVVGTVNEALRHAVGVAQHRATVRVERVPIALRGPYDLSLPLRIESHVRGQGFEIEFVGRHPRGDHALPSTFRRDPYADPLRPLLEFADGVRVSFSHVAFDARHPANSGTMVSERGEIVHEGFSNGVNFRRCTFWFDRGDLLTLGLAENDADGLIVENPTGRAVFEECWFEGSGGAPLGSAIRIAERGTPRLRLDGCSFLGEANAMVAVPAGLVEVVGCDFHNEPRDPTQVRAIVTDEGGDREREFPRATFVPGVDLLVGRPARTSGEHLVQAAWERAKDLPGNPSTLGLSVAHVQSRSARFLVGDRYQAPENCFVSLTGLICRPSTTFAAQVPSLRWRGRTGGVLVQGCDLGGSVDCGTEPVVSAASRLRRGLLGASAAQQLAPR